MSTDYQPWDESARDPFVYRWVDTDPPRIGRYMPGVGHHGCDVHCAWVGPTHPDYARAKREADAEKVRREKTAAALIYTVRAPTHNPVPNCPQPDQGTAGETE